MEEKRIEEERIFNEMAYQFLMNRAARTIQRFWRAFCERKQARRKGRKGKSFNFGAEFSCVHRILKANFH